MLSVKQGLTFKNIRDDVKKYIITKENFLDHNLCDSLISDYSRLIAKEKPFFYQGSWFGSLFDCSHTIHEHLLPLWEEVIKFYNCDINFIEQYSIRRYTFGNFYGKHSDNYGITPNLIDRKISMVVQLSDDKDYGGGDVIVAGNIVSRKKGTVVFFPSSYTYEVTRVGFGSNWSIVSWALGPL
jgi:hypothetical protein